MSAGPGASSAGDPLGAALLPVLLHRLGNAGQLLSALRSVLGLEGGERALHERADDLATTAREVEELGWALAALASASGADLLLARREPRGADILLDLRETYAATLDEAAAGEYRAAFTAAARRRFRSLTTLLEDLDA